MQKWENFDYEEKGSIQPTTHTEATESASSPEKTDSQLRFRNEKLLNEHYDQHGIEMGFSSAEEYEKAAAAVVTSPDTTCNIVPNSF